MDDRTKEFLLARRSLAEKATPGPWEKKQKRFFGDDEETPYVAVENRIILYPGQRGGAEAENTTSFCAANSPDVVMADIDEILRLRADMKRLEKEANWLAHEVSSLEHDQLDGTGGVIREVQELREQARCAVECGYSNHYKKGE